MSNLSELLPTGGGQNAVEFTAAENISSGQAVALKTDGQIEAADSANLANVIGLAAAAITSGATGDINVFGGINEAQSSLTIGTNYYINSSGSLTTSSTFPNIELGQAISATTINLRDNSDNYNPLVQGQQEYISAGSYTWVAPAGVTSVSVVAVGGAAGSGGGLGYKNSISVTPGDSYSVVVGAGIDARAYTNLDSYFVSTSTVAGFGADTSGGGSYFGDGGGNGGLGPLNYSSIKSGGGAGGYSGSGGAGVGAGSSGNAGAGGAGGSAGANSSDGGGGGGGVGILGEGSSGAGGTTTTGGGGGSGGSNGMAPTASLGGNGGLYGGGCGVKGTISFNGHRGAVRIIWSNSVTRAFPSTNTGDL